MTDQIRIDVSGFSLYEHPEVFAGFPKHPDFLNALAEDLQTNVDNFTVHPSLMSHVKSLKVTDDAWLMWWGDIFIGQFTSEYYIQGGGVIEYIDDAFWNDLIIFDGTALFEHNNCWGDLKIRAERRFVDYLVVQDTRWNWYERQYKRPDYFDHDYKPL